MSYSIFTSFDEGYFETAAVMISTMSDNYFGSEKLKVYCLVPSNLIPFQDKFLDIIRHPSNLDVVFKTTTGYLENIESKIGSNDIGVEWITPNCFHRIFIASAFPELDKAIYIDPDIVVMRNIQPILDFPLYNKIIAHVEIMPPDGVSKDSNYFNNGVYITDLNFWRNNLLEQQMLDFMHVNGMSKHTEQDLMNIFLKDYLYPLPRTMNLFSYQDHINFFREATPDPILVHFVGPLKPWKNHDVERRWTNVWRKKYLELFGVDISLTKEYNIMYNF